MSEKKFLPEFETQEKRDAFFAVHAKERFIDERKHYYSEAELNDMARESSAGGGEMLVLDAILKNVQELVKKGCEEEISIVFPQTAGKDSLTEVRKKNDTLVRKGFTTLSEEVFGFVDEDAAEMRYFSKDGVEMYERRRSLSAKEKREYLGLFASIGAAPKAPEMKTDETDFLMQKTGTDDGVF